MKNKKEKASIDIESIHQGLIDSYHVDDNKMKKDMNEIQDFQSVTESIEKLENIIEDGKELAKKDKNYDEFLAGVKSNLIEQKSQLFKLKLSNAESNVSSMLSNIDDDATSNDFIGIDREIKKYSDLVFSLKEQSGDSSEQKSLWDEYHNKIDIFHTRVQKKRIQSSVRASKNRVEAVVTDFEKTIDHVKYTLVRKDLNAAKKSLKKLQATIDEAQITGQKDEGYSEWLEKQTGKYKEYDANINDIDLKIDIEQHRKALEEAQPDIVKGINELNRNIEGHDFIEEQLEEEVNEEEDLWDSNQDKEDLSHDEKNKEIKKQKTSSLKLITEIILYTGMVIGAIYFTSQNYIELRNLKSQLPIKERRLHLISGTMVGNQIEKNKLVDSQNAKRAILLSKLLSMITPKSVSMNEIVYTTTSNNTFSFQLKGEISDNNQSAVNIFNNFISELRKQTAIKRVIIRDQKLLSKSNLIFTIDLKS
tara:strand:+ start:2187 stop:3617 length:1431 start_codon:yes stop_codon:yes gene_type:complete